MSDLPTDATWATVQKLAACHEEISDVRQAWLDCREDVTTLRQELDEARAALRDAEFHIAEWSPTVHAEAWGLEHAAALKAAREAKL